MWNFGALKSLLRSVVRTSVVASNLTEGIYFRFSKCFYQYYLHLITTFARFLSGEGYRMIIRTPKLTNHENDSRFAYCRIVYRRICLPKDRCLPYQLIFLHQDLRFVWYRSLIYFIIQSFHLWVCGPFEFEAIAKKWMRIACTEFGKIAPLDGIK